MVSLNKPTIGSKDWGTDVNNNWTDLEDEVIDKSLIIKDGEVRHEPTKEATEPTGHRRRGREGRRRHKGRGLG